MAYVPIANSIDSNLDTTGIEATPKTPFMTGIGIDLEDTIRHTFIGFGAYELEKLYKSTFDQGDFLTGDQIKEKYPNISEPNGAYENVVKLKSDRKAATQFANEVVANMDKNFFTYGARLGQFFLGNALDPLQIVTGGAIGKLISKPIGYLYPSLAKIPAISESVSRALTGAVEGTAHALPYAGVQIAEAKDMQEKVNVFSLISTVGLGAVLGSTMRTAFGFKDIIPPETKDTIIKTASNQIKAGKTVDVDLIVKDALYKASLKHNNENIDLAGTIDKMQKRYAEVKENLNSRIEEFFPDEHKKVKEILREGNEVPKGKMLTISLKEHEIPTESRALYRKASKYETLEKFINSIKKDEEGNPIFKGELVSEGKGKEVFSFVEDIKERLQEHKETLEKHRGIFKESEKFLKDTTEYVDLMESKHEPVDPKELSAKIKEIHSWRGDDTTYMDDIEEANNLVNKKEKALDEELQIHKEHFQELSDSGKLNEDEKLEIREAERHVTNVSKIKEATGKFMQCIIGSKD